MKTFNLFDIFTQDKFYLTQSYMANKTYYSQFGLLGHEGCDFGHTNKTMPVRSCLAGECLTAYSSTYGRYVIVLDYHQLIAVYYCHLSKAQVVSGQEIKAGEIIGNMGSTGNSTGPHVHFNFCIINEQGTRQYKTKSQNMGFLDPRHPLDKSDPVKFTGVPEYTNNWTDKITMPTTSCQNLLDHLKVKTIEEAQTVWDKEMRNLEKERLNVVELKQQLSDFNMKWEQREEEFVKSEGSWKALEEELRTQIKVLKEKADNLEAELNKPQSGNQELESAKQAVKKCELLLKKMIDPKKITIWEFIKLKWG